jgi:UDP-N-acetylglucosamine/UDP-N-acetylgalactosamine diphosphorylase
MLMMPDLVDELTSADLERVKNDLLCRLRAAVPSQEHVLAHWEQLDEIAKAKLATQIDDVDFDLLRTEEARPQAHQQSEESLQPPPVVTLEEQSSSHEAVLEGELCLTEGRVGVVLVAGGMGTRLGFEQPKGMFPIGPVSGNSLFQVLIERIVALGRRYGVRIPLYLMTSDVTHKATVRFLREHDAFGLNPDDLRVFCQGTLPAICATTRRLLLASPGELAVCPDGHGGLLEAARKCGCFDDMARRGIDVLFYGQMDNPLLHIADPELIGQHLLANADITTQVVRRANPIEKVGMFVSRDSKVWVLEYSELPKEIATATDDDGQPLFWAANTGVHLFRVPFLKRIASLPNALLAHPCRKQVAHLDAEGKIQQPVEPNAIKFEKFIFDLMHHTNRSVLVESDRATTFAPVKNPDSMTTDTAATARTAMVKLHTDWLRHFGTEVAPGVDVEISPLFALNKSDLGGKTLATSIDEPTFLT